jgi:acetyl-CoA carboxylase biotin carboxyl carrier protein
MMDIQQVRELIEMMKENDLNELKIVDGETRIFLRRGFPAPPPGPLAVGHPQVIAPSVNPASAIAAVEPKPDHLKEIVSPIVGTFYCSPSPSADPFVKVGAHVDADSVVCIIEAMKVMNEVKSELNGVIKKVLVENGAAVEFGQPLFLVETE